MERKALINARLRKNLTQEELAERVKVQPNTVYRWESGMSRMPRGYNLHALCDVLGATAEELGLEGSETAQAEATVFSEKRTEPTIAIGEFLPQCANALKACWHLLHGRGLAVAPELLATYTPTLMVLMAAPSAYQETIASLATQAKILQAILAMHTMNIVGREVHSLEAVEYAALSGDSGLVAAAKMTVGYTYTYCVRRPQKAINAYLEALHALGDEVSLLRSDIYMGLADAYAQQREEQLALSAIGLAKEHFPDHPELDPRFLYADCTASELYQWEGKMYLDLAQQYPGRGYYQSAYDSFTESASLHAVAERSEAETLIHYAEAAAGLADMEHYANTLRSGALLALEVGSQKRFNEALTVFKRTPATWLREPAIQALDDDIFHHRQTRRIAQ